MEIEIISFGHISEFIPIQKIDIRSIGDTDVLKKHLEERFPRLSEVKYKIAVNQDIIQSKQSLANHDIIAIMPPFSGG